MFNLLLQSSDWPIFIGRFHPVLVHLPIGFLLLTAILEVLRRLDKIVVPQSLIRLLLLLSATGATLACVAGYLLADGGGYDNALVDSHMWKGIGIAVCAWIAWLFTSNWLTIRLKQAPVFASSLLLIATLLTLIAGHDGGALTHGEGYLTQHTPEPFRSLVGMPANTGQVADLGPIADVPNAMVYADIIRPVMEKTCVQCHGSGKQKGDLRLDNFGAIMKGGKGGPVIVAGNSAESELIKRSLLPLDDEKHMAPKGKTQLTENQIKLIAWWIDQGAPENKKVSELKSNDDVELALISLGKSEQKDAGNVAANEIGKSVPPGNPQAIEAVKKVNLLVLPHAHNLIEISAVNKPELTDDQVGLLKPLSEQIVWLKIGGTKITDRALKEISGFKNLTRLHLENTAITDAGLHELTGLPQLDYINLVGTRVTDAGLKKIAKLEGLKSIFVWQSAITENGIEELHKSHPDIQVISGLDEKSVAEFIKIGAVQKTE
jgi:mono/diheme cytochrome c family protein/uncharacterized membrane protein